MSLGTKSRERFLLVLVYVFILRFPVAFSVLVAVCCSIILARSNVTIGDDVVL